MNWIRPILVAAGVGCGLVGPLQAQTTGIFADVATSLGTFTVQLDYVRAPRATANFIGLATGARAWCAPESSGIRSNDFYAGTAVHLIRYDDTSVPGTTNVLGFQAGLRPVRGTGGSTNWTGGPGYTILDETTNGLSHSNGVIAMVQMEPHSAGSEFLVTRTNAAAYFDGLQTVFGRVVSNMAVVDALAATPMNGGVPAAPPAISNVAIRRVGAAAEAFDVAAWNLPTATESETALTVKSGTNLSTVAYDVPARSLYCVAHATNLAPPAWSIDVIDFNAQTQAIRATNAFLAQTGAFGAVHFFHAVQARYPVYSAIPAGSGIVFAARWRDGTTYQYQLNLTGAWGSCTGLWISISNSAVTGAGTVSGTYWWWTRTPNSTRFNFMDNLGFVTDYTLGFDVAGARTGRFHMALSDWWGFPLGSEFGSCEWAPWTPGTKAPAGRSTKAAATEPTGQWRELGRSASDSLRRSVPVPAGATRAPGCRPFR